MNITEVRIRLVDAAKLKAFATITLDSCFVVRGLKVIEGKTGMFVAMPSRKQKNGEFVDIAHPINMESRAIMERMILKAYHKALQDGDGVAGTGVVAWTPPPPKDLFGGAARDLEVDDEPSDGDSVPPN